MAHLPPHLKTLIPSASGPAPNASPSLLSDWVGGISDRVSQQWDHWTEVDEKKFSETMRLLQELLSHFVSQGNFTVAPNTSFATAQGFDPLFLPVAGQSGVLGVKLKNNGAVSQSLSRSSSPVPQWLVLLHEASHQEFELNPQPFCPTPSHAAQSHLSGTDVQQIGKWNSSRSEFMYGVLNESFADVHAMMLLISSVEGAQRQHVINELKMVRNTRVRIGEEEDQKFVEEIRAIGHLKAHHHKHQTAPAIDHMFNRLDEWVDLPPDQMRQMAFQLSSDGFVDLINPNRKVNGFPVGLVNRFPLITPNWFTSIAASCHDTAMGYVLGSNIRVMEHTSTSPFQGEVLSSLENKVLQTIKEQFPHARASSLDTPVRSALGMLVSSPEFNATNSNQPSRQKICSITDECFGNLLITPSMSKELAGFTLEVIQSATEMKERLFDPFCAPQSKDMPLELLATLSALQKHIGFQKDSMKMWEANSVPDASPRSFKEILANPEPVLVSAPSLSGSSLKDRLNTQRTANIHEPVQTPLHKM